MHSIRHIVNSQKIAALDSACLFLAFDLSCFCGGPGLQGEGQGCCPNILQCTEWPSFPPPTKNYPTQMEITLRLKNPGPHNKHNNSRSRETIATVRIFITNFKLSMKGMKDSLRKKHKINTNNY